MHCHFNQKRVKRNQAGNLLKAVLTKQFLSSIEKQYPVTYTMTLYPQMNKNDLVKIVKSNSDRACLEMQTIYHIDITEYVNKA
jgi:hypothetical protein